MMPISRPKKRAALGALEVALWAALIGKRTIEQAGAIDSEKMRLDVPTCAAAWRA